MNNRLNTYLRDVETRLRSLPESDREQEIAEIAQHLDTLIAARQSEGQTEEEATADAIAQFGTARDIGSGLYKTGRHKRFVPLIEIGLFSSAFSTMFWLTNQVFIRLLQAASPPSTAANINVFLTHWPLTSWPISWSIGLAAFMIIALRYGVRGLLQKAHAQTPVGAAMRWLFFVFFVGTIPAWFITSLWGMSFSHLTPIQQHSYIILSNMVSLAIAWLTAYLIGWRNKFGKSVADAVACAAAVSTLTSLLQMLVQFVPTPWDHNKPAPFSANLSGYLISFFIVAVHGTLQVLVARFGVQIGEKTRRQSHYVKQTA